MCRSDPHNDAISVFTMASVSQRFGIGSIGDISNVVNTERLGCSHQHFPSVINELGSVDIYVILNAIHVIPSAERNP